MEVDFLTNVETAFLNVFTANTLLKQYNWLRWDSDEEVELPRGVLVMRARRDPDDTPYHRVEIKVQFEGRPKQQKLSAVVNELKNVLETTTETNLGDACQGTVQFMGRAIAVSQTREIVSGLRTWTFTFSIYALPMV